MADTIRERLEKADKLFEEYAKSHKIDQKLHDEVEEYRNMGEAELRGLSSEDCAIASVLLQRHSAYVQRLYNRELRVFNWCESSIKLVIAHEIFEYTYCSADEKKFAAIKNSEVATKFLELQVIAKQNLDELTNLSLKISDLAKSFDNLSKMKKHY